MASDQLRGSEWRKWDLHLHTPASYFNSYTDNWDDYVDDVIEAADTHEIEAFATADYFTISGYEKFLEYYDKDTQVLTSRKDPQKSRKIFIVPGIELRVKEFASDRASINLHVIFDPDVSVQFIRQNFLEELKFSYQGKDLKLNEQNLLAAGKSISESSAFNQTADFTGITEPDRKRYLTAAFKTITLDKSDIKSAIKEINTILEATQKKPAIIAVAVKGHGGIDSLDWFDSSGAMSRAGLLREDFSADADLFFSWNSADIDFYLGKLPGANVEEIISRFGRVKPCIWGSDAHSKANIFHPSNGATRNYTWIKADTTYEGLKQILFEPEQRISIQENNPCDDYPKSYLSKIEISAGKILDSKKPRFADTTIHLNRDMIALIGGRGSGKSLLIDVLASVFGKELGGDESRLSRIDKTLDFKVDFTKPDGEDTVYKLGARNHLDYLHVHQGQVKEIVTDHTSLDREVKKLLGIKIESDEITLDEKAESELIRLASLLDFFDETNTHGVPTNTVEYQKARKKKYQELIDTITTEKNKSKINLYRLNSVKYETLSSKSGELSSLLDDIRNDSEKYSEHLQNANSINPGVFTDELDSLIASLPDKVTIEVDTDGILSIKGVQLDEEQKGLLEIINADGEVGMAYQAVNDLKEFIPQIPSIDLSKQIEAIELSIRNIGTELVKINEANEAIKQEFIDSGIGGDINKLLNSVKQYQASINTLDKNISIINTRHIEVNKMKADLLIKSDDMERALNTLKTEIDEKWELVKNPDDQTAEQIYLTEQLLSEIEVSGEIQFDKKVFYEKLCDVLNLTRFRPPVGKTVTQKIEEVFGIKSATDLIKFMSDELAITIDGRSYLLSEFLSQHDYFVQKGRADFLK